jgi:hypothetical protein
MKLPVVEKKLHLYVWDQFAPERNYGLAFAIAEDEDAARKLVTQAMGYTPSDWGDTIALPLSAPIAYAVGGGS